MFACFVNYSEYIYLRLSTFTDVGPPLLRSLLLCQITWFLLGSAFYCPIVRTLILNWGNVDSIFLSKYTSTATLACLVILCLSRLVLKLLFIPRLNARKSMNERAELSAEVSAAINVRSGLAHRMDGENIYSMDEVHTVRFRLLLTQKDELETDVTLGTGRHPFLCDKI